MAWETIGEEWRGKVPKEAIAEAVRLAMQAFADPDVRFGQLLANLGFLAEDMSDRTLWDIEDTELLQVIERHRTDLSKRQPNDA